MYCILLKKLRVLGNVCVAREKHNLMKSANWKEQFSIVFSPTECFYAPVKQQYSKNSIKINNIMGEGHYVRYKENNLEFAKLVMQAVHCIS
jgi:hypothetical protein